VSKEVDPDDENAANEFAANEHASSSSPHGDISHTLSATNLKSDK
jgi:hypothetical protein